VADAIERLNEKEMSLTDMWKAAGSDPSKQPAEWQRQTHGREVVLAASETLGIGQGSLIRTVPGRNGGTWAPVGLAMAYAHFLNARFYWWCITDIIVPYFEGGLQPKEENGQRMLEDSPAVCFQLERSVLGVVRRSGRITNDQATDELIRIARKYLSPDFLLPEGTARVSSPP
jgi:hypothetical protein